MERVELAVHTGHSMNNGIGNPKDFIKYAIDYGMSAMAVTDIGTVTAFPELYHGQKLANGFKMIYGIDAIVLDDTSETSSLSILIKDEIGRRNLYEILSESEQKLGTGANSNTVIPLNLLLEKREGLLIGSGRKNGMLQKAIKAEQGLDSSVEIKSIAEILDYVEIPYGCDEELAKKLLEISEHYNLIPVAVCAPYCTDIFGKIARSVLNDVNAMTNDCSLQESKNEHFMGTDKLLKHFSYLGEEKAYEIVVKNTNDIAEMCQLEAPFSNHYKTAGTTSDNEELRERCLNALKDIYPEFDQVTLERLEWELGAIEKTDSAYMFLNIIRLKEKYNIKQYEMGSRGGIGASFVAYLLGITEIDPIKYGISPFFFFGENGEKEPDIDLNLTNKVQQLFQNDYKNLPGISNTYKCITYRTMYENQARKMVSGFETINKVSFEDEYRTLLAEKLSATVIGKGQHPCGMLLVPENVCIYDDMPLKNIGTVDEPVMATGFEWHQVDHIYRKVDFLSHNGTEVLSRLSEITGVNPLEIEFDNPEVMAMFSEKSDESKVYDCFGVPEFRTEFMMELISKTNPKNFNDLVSLLGLAHGTDVWIGNAEKLIADGIADISEVISSRDDVYRRLVEAGINCKTSFNIAEAVRKGIANKSRGRNQKFSELWNYWIEIMREHGIPEWFIESCETISYLFPRAHAIAYMQCSWRLAWFKLYYPTEFSKVMEEIYE